MISNTTDSAVNPRTAKFLDNAYSHNITIKQLSCTFGKHRALDSISLNVNSGEMVALIGPSGAGKSTLLRNIAGLVAADATSGPLSIGDKTVQSAGRIYRDVRSHRAKIGFIFQQFNLVNRLNLLTNVLTGHLAGIPLPRRMLGIFTHDEKLEAMLALRRVGLEKNALQRADTLSGGQQQRAAVARAIVQQAKIILADEPIASLDPESARIVMGSLRELNQQRGVSVVVSVHQIEQAHRYCDRMIGLRAGRIHCDCSPEQLTDQDILKLYKQEAA